MFNKLTAAGPQVTGVSAEQSTSKQLSKTDMHTVFVQENILAAKLLSHDECLYLPNMA